ncbi:50S ribosomal protein L25 [Candidatus Woesebacteria bacterium]|nr:50S ribosomal protein L25 [Candidatus Woesebacteria bacterium]
MAQDKVIFHATARDENQKAKHVRKEGRVPANVYGLNKPSQSISVEANAFNKLYDETGDTGLIYIKVGDTKEQPVLIDDVSYESVGNRVLHVSFKRVNLKVAVTADVPIELIGENNIPETIVTQVRQDVEVEALPADLPDKFELNISQLTEVGQTFTLADLQFDTSKISLVLGEDVDPAEETLVVLQQIHEEVEAEEDTSETTQENPEGETTKTPKSPQDETTGEESENEAE